MNTQSQISQNEQMKTFYNLRRTAARVLSSSVQKSSLTRSRKLNKWANWVTPSMTRNFILQDLISDILMRKKIKRSSVTGKSQNQSGHFILEQGNEFERRVVQMIKDKFPNEFSDIKGNELPRSYVLADKTLDDMKKGTPIIFSPVFHCFDKKINGVPDLLVRSDYLYKLFTEPPSVTDDGCQFSTEDNRWYYVIVDIKFSTVHLRSNGREMLNNTNSKAYKAQLFLYNEILSRMQKFDPEVTYILGRNYKYSNTNEGDVSGNGCFDRPGVIDYSGWDESYKKRTLDSVKWLRKVDSIAATFDLNKIHDYKEDLSPNMCVQNLFVQGEKHKIAEQIRDITMIPYCGVKNRNIAKSNGIVQWSDLACTAEKLGFKNTSYRGPIVDACLLANKPTHLDNVVVLRPEWTAYPSLVNLEDRDNVVYLDFETINNACDDFSCMPAPSDMNLAFMLTIGVVHNNRLTTKTFTAKGLSERYERDMFDEALVAIRSLVSFSHSMFVHWGAHDRTVWERVTTKYIDLLGAQPMDWYNAHRVYENHAFGVNGAFSSSLKSVTNSLNTIGRVKQRFDKGEDGLEAMHKAYIAHQESDKDVFIAHPYIRDMKSYNVKDVRALYEVVTYLRTLV